MLEEEFHIQMQGDRKEMLKIMCNLSQGIKEQGIEQGLEQGLEQGRRFEIFTSVQEGDYSIERGAQKMNLSVAEFTRQMTSAGYKVPVNA